MWAHYAKDHTGAVFEFLSLPEADNPLSVARPVRYVDRPPSFFTEREWVDHILTLKRLEPEKLYRRYGYYKSAHWGYEREWRVWYPLGAEADGLFEDLSIRSSEFSRLDFGCRADPDFVHEAAALARSAYPGLRIYRAQKSDTEFGLDYDEI